jgi:uncharacterized protein with NAD-binding domain and iron-sulfur cluster
VPDRPLGELYRSEVWKKWPNVRFHFRSNAVSLNGVCRLEDGMEHRADFYVLAVPFERISAVCPAIGTPAIEHSPITSVHLWFDRAVTELPHATLLDSPLQWMFNKGSGRHVQVVVSASRDWTRVGSGELIQTTVKELTSFFPAVADAQLLKGRVVKEVRATISAVPGVDEVRPVAATSDPRLFLAGDWTRTGWPSTMEGAVRSGYAAAEALTAEAGMPCRFLLGEINDHSSIYGETG